MFSDLPTHPFLVHLPLGLAVVMPLLAAAVLTGWKLGWFDRKVWWLVVGLQVVMLAGGVAAKQSGEDDEDAVEEIVGHDLIHDHEEAGERLVLGMVVLLLVSVAAGAVPKQDPAFYLGIAALVVSAAVLAMAVQTGKLGGELVYEHGAAGAHVKHKTGGGADGEHD